MLPHRGQRDTLPHCQPCGWHRYAFILNLLTQKNLDTMGIFTILNLGYKLVTGNSILHDVLEFYGDTDWAEIADLYPW